MAAAVAAVPWFGALTVHDSGTMNDFIHRIIDITFYGTNETGSAIGAVVAGNLPGAPWAPGTTSGLALAAVRINPRVEGTNGNPAAYSIANTVPLVNNIIAFGGGGWVPADGIRAGIHHYLDTQLNNAGFRWTPVAAAAFFNNKLAKIYMDARKMYDALAALPVEVLANAASVAMYDSIYKTYKEVLMKVFISLISPVVAPVPGGGVPEAAVTNVSDAVQEILKTVSGIATHDATAPYQNKYLKYKQKYLTLKNEK